MTRSGASARGAELHAYTSDVRPLLEANCFSCHAGKKHKGGISFADLTDDRAALRQRRLWRKSVAQLESLQMPPSDEDHQPRPEQRQQLIQWMRSTIENVDPNDAFNRNPGPAVIRRLSLAEYNNTIRDLFGFPFDAAEATGMTDENGGGNDFGNLAAALDVPPALMDKYFTAADKVLDRFFGTELSSTIDGEILERALLARERMFSAKPWSLRNPATQIAPPPGVSERDAAKKILADFAARAYRRPLDARDLEQLLTVYDKASARKDGYVNSIRLAMKAVLVSPRFLFRIEQDDSAPPEANGARPVSDQELAVRLSYFLWSSMPDDELASLAARHLLTAPGASSEPVRLNGTPIGTVRAGDREHTPDKAFDQNTYTFFEGAGENDAWAGLDLHEPKVITQVAYIGRYGEEPRMIGGLFQGSNTPDFSSGVIELCKVTVAPPPGERVTQQVAPAAAVRYVRYLGSPRSWAHVTELEFRGKQDGTVLMQQVRRMLADPKARAITDNFASGWLQIRKLPSARPSTEFYPDFQPDVRKAMYDETATFFDHLRIDDRPVTDALNADYTYLNEELAKYYKIPGITGKEMRRVPLEPAFHRGGVLGMGSVLALTSATSRTSPSLRGKWVMEVILGTPPPPPPANAGMFKDDQDKAKTPKTFRERMAMHAADPACASCHTRMDPLGYAMENFDAAGIWRDNDHGHALDNAGLLPTGEKMQGIDGLKQVCLQHQDQFVQNLIRQMLTYALGRELDYYDDLPVKQIQTDMANNGNRFSALIADIVGSYPFQYRRGVEPENPRAGG